ncbi:MAG: hypothetical protein HQK49_14205 [Oligoflexia bacterium]|nr:hypothetical protein [Oligoflexia bacterium]
MSKYFFILLLATLFISTLAFCSEEDEDNNNDDSDDVTTVTPSEPVNPLKIGDNILEELQNSIQYKIEICKNNSSSIFDKLSIEQSMCIDDSFLKQLNTQYTLLKKLPPDAVTSYEERYIKIISQDLNDKILKANNKGEILIDKNTTPIFKFKPSPEEIVFIEKLKLKDELENKIKTSFNRIRNEILNNPQGTEEMINKEFLLINDIFSKGISNSINFTGQVNDSIKFLNQNYQSWNAQLMARFNISSLAFENNIVKSVKVQNPPAEGVIASEILSFMNDLIQLKKNKNQANAEKLTVTFNNFKSKYPEYLKIISIALRTCRLATVVKKLLKIDLKDNKTKNVLSELSNFSNYFQDNQQINKLTKDYEYAITYTKNKISIESLPQIINWQCRQLSKLPEENKIIRNADTFLTKERLDALNMFFDSITHENNENNVDKKLLEKIVVEINKALKMCEMGEVIVNEEKKIIYKPSKKETLLVNRGKSLMDVISFLKKIRNNDPQINEKQFREKIIELNKIIQESKLSAFYKSDLFPVINEINKTASINFNISSIRISEDNKLIIDELKNPVALDIIKNEIMSFLEELISFKEDKNPNNSSNHLEVISKKFEDFKTKYPEYFNILITTLAPSALVDVTKKTLTVSNINNTNIKLLSSLVKFKKIFPDQKLYELLFNRYKKIDPEAIDKESLCTIDRSKCSELTDEEMAAIKLFSDDQGCRIINIQNRIAPLSLEQLTDPSNPLGWISQTICQRILDNILPQTNIYYSNSSDHFSGKLSEAMKFINDMIKDSKNLFSNDLESLSSRCANDVTLHSTKYSTKDIANFFNSGVCKLPNKSGCFYHGIPISSSLDNKKLKIGDKITLSDFLSTSSNKAIAWSFSGNTSKMAIIATKTAKDIMNLSDVDDEKEHLLLPKTKLRIVDIIKTMPEMLGFSDNMYIDDAKDIPVDLDTPFTLILVEEI